jgi:hypothetical protein
MNERIRELAISTGIFDSLCDPFDELKNGDYYSSVMVDLEKFAQLIVQECISINRQRIFSDYEGDSLRVAHNNALLCATSDMFEHFGVGE